ncbi:MAG: hypothetical protein RSH25_17350 [Bacteroides sp.]|uniref:hypothetical protein n=1 Tax=Bacteroides sp. TaxID=29523 RepID=UPI002FC59BDE
MENMISFVSVVIIIFGILQIILFFKIWGMTNNVQRINNKVGLISGADLELEIRKAVLKGDKKKAEELLFDEFIKDIKKRYEDYDRSNEEEMNKLKSEYSKYYEQIGSSIPEALQRLNSKEDFQKVFTFSI